MYLRTEVRFYKEVLPELQRKRGGFHPVATPKVYKAEYDLKGLIGEEERTTDQTMKEPDDITSTWMSITNSSTAKNNGKGGFIIMESIGESHYYQDSPITLDQAKETLSAIASLHASAWEDRDLLQKSERCLSRGSYHLGTRNPKELEGMEQAWENFSASFGHLNPDLFARTKDMGKRIHDVAHYISREVSPGPNDPYATLAHGDFKSMNCFLPKTTNNNGERSSRGVILVDFASTGVGLGMSDVAMHIHHAVRPTDLDNGGEEELVDYYLQTLQDKLGGPSSRCSYPRDVALRHYRLAVADYFRFFLGRFWKSATPQSFETKKDSKNTALINRDVDAALAFLDRVDRYVAQIQKEKGECEHLLE
jgi:thiamine kinase-like enzyme